MGHLLRVGVCSLFLWYLSASPTNARQQDDEKPASTADATASEAASADQDDPAPQPPPEILAPTNKPQPQPPEKPADPPAAAGKSPVLPSDEEKPSLPPEQAEMEADNGSSLKLGLNQNTAADQHLRLHGPASVDVLVKAVDEAGNLNPAFTGTARFKSSDPLATLPDDYTFTAGDRGWKTFTIIVRSTGEQTLSVTRVDAPKPSAEKSAPKDTSEPSVENPVLSSKKSGLEVPVPPAEPIAEKPAAPKAEVEEPPPMKPDVKKPDAKMPVPPAPEVEKPTAPKPMAEKTEPTPDDAPARPQPKQPTQEKPTVKPTTPEAKPEKGAAEPPQTEKPAAESKKPVAPAPMKQPPGKTKPESVLKTKADEEQPAPPATKKKPAAKPAPKKPDKRRLAITDRSQAGQDFAFQGEYFGAVPPRVSNVPNMGLQVIARGDGQFDAVLLRGGLPGAGWDRRTTVMLSGQLQDGVVMLTSDIIAARVSAGQATLLELNGTELAHLPKMRRISSTQSAAPPYGAIVLFDGTTADQFDGAGITDDGLLEVGGLTKMEVQDFRLHLEFRLPYMPFAKGQGRGNSGVYIQQRYEVQILDSFGLEGLHNECGGLYKQRPPAVNMCLPPLSWQTYDIYFTAARWDTDGNKVANARITVVHNGETIHDNYELTGKTGAGKPEEPTLRPILLQDHGNPVHFRNVWLLPLQPASCAPATWSECSPVPMDGCIDGSYIPAPAFFSPYP